MTPARNSLRLAEESSRGHVILLSSSPQLPSARASGLSPSRALPGLRNAATDSSSLRDDARLTAKRDVFVVADSTPDSAAKGKGLPPGQQNPTSIDNGTSFEIEPAVRRRQDWTPPPMDSAIILDSDASSGGLEAWSSPNAAAARIKTKQIFDTLRDSFTCMDDDSETNPSVPAGDTFIRRKAIEAISIGDTGPPPEKTSPVKAKRPRKKPRTITELAVAAYATPDTASDTAETENCISNTTTVKRKTTRKKKNVPDTSTETNKEVVYNPGHPASKLRKGMKLQPKDAKKRRRKTAPASRPVLLSPRSAMEESQGQDFVFGTSSQLVREDSPGFLRDLQSAMQSSNREEADFFAGADSVDLASKTTPSTTSTKMWAVSARGMDGKLAYTNVIDLEDDIEFPEDPEEVVRRAAEAELQKDTQTNTASNSRPRQRLSVETAAKTAAETAAETTENSTASPSGSNKHSHGPGVRHSTQTSQAAPEPIPTITATPRPSFELLTTTQLAKQVSSFGYKPIRQRRAMIALLQQCWDAKHPSPAGPVGQVASLSSSAGAADDNGAGAKTKRADCKKAPQAVRPPAGRKRATQTVATSKSVGSNLSSQGTMDLVTASRIPEAISGASGASTASTLAPGSQNGHKAPEMGGRRGRGMSVEPCVFEIEDSESDGRLSGGEEAHRSQFSLAADSLSSTSDDDAASTGSADSIDALLVGTPTGEESALFAHISRAVLGEPRSTDPANPSWYEKILMYDTIILETFAAWLNGGPLLQAGYAGRVEPAEVKRWCESKSVCCTWKRNLHGKERKL